MTAIGLVLGLLLATQDPPAEAQAPSRPSLAEQARAERQATLARRKAAQSKKDQARAQRRAEAAKREADLRDYEMKMAPIVARQQIEMAKLQAARERNAIQAQGLSNLQAIEAQRLANENYYYQLRYLESLRPIQVLVGPTGPVSPTTINR